ncbi:helix-turn-helix domain-containing protein [Thermopolyspora sp. NPDC052614]|uniref:helix-turn-helix domain-containing protein n=1 Tax=Thermopolyspora sp. NPDC052614 TaxID=3155682 RepID=UPI00343266ED
MSSVPTLAVPVEEVRGTSKVNDRQWVSSRAVAWVIHEAPVPADLAFTLTVIAARCDENGRGSYQSIATIAALVGKSCKQAQRDIARLRELGLLLIGDQSLVEHLPPGRRPVVYDVPLHMCGPKPAKESRNKSGVRKARATCSAAGTPPMDGTPPADVASPTDGVPTPPMDGVPTPPIHGDQTILLNKPEKNFSLSQREHPAEPASPDEREIDSGVDPFIAWLMAEHDAGQEEVASILRDVQREGRIVSVVAWAFSATGRADFARRLDDNRRFLTVTRGRLATEKPRKCGECDGTGWRGEDDEGRPWLCPHCKPHLAHMVSLAAVP